MISNTLNKTAEIRARIEPELKAEAISVLSELGLTLSEAFRLLLRQVVAHHGLPFEVKVPNATTVAAMEEARSITKARYSDAQDLFNDLEEENSTTKKNKPTQK